MFGLLKKKNPYEAQAGSAYHQVMKESRSPLYYKDYDVPDSFDGRFEMLIVCAFTVIEATISKDEARGIEFNQALFDHIFREMHIALREIGVGDVGIPKHIQKMMKAFNGRMHRYSEALEHGQFDAALKVNLYGTVDGVDDKTVKALAKRVKAQIKTLEAMDFEAIVHSNDLFKGKA